MPYSIVPAVDEDFPKIALDCYEAFWDPVAGEPDSVFLNAIHPAMQTPEGMQAAIARLKQTHDDSKADPWKFVKAVEDGQPVGMMWWLAAERATRPTSDWLKRSFYDNDEDHEFALTLVQANNEAMWRAIPNREVPLISLIMLSTQKDFHGKGAGKALLMFLMGKAEETGADIVLQAAPKARGFYKRHGFTEVYVLPTGRHLL